MVNSSFIQNTHTEYLTVTRLLWQTRQKDIESLEVNSNIELLEERLSHLSVEIASHKGMADMHPKNPLWELWNQNWTRLGESRRNHRYEDEETAWSELRAIAAKLDLQSHFSIS